MTPVEVIPGDGPVVLGQPHGGTWLLPEVLARLNATGQTLSDTDWHIGRLYDGLLPGATVVRATFHRYLIDANRDPSGASLYPGQNTTGLVPATDFDGNPIWTEEPSADEIEARRRDYHARYHAALAAELDRVKARHGFAILWDCHSIRSEIPFLFDGTLPALNIGTNGGLTCHPILERRTAEACRQSPFATVLNGRFKGGWTTRHYGRPSEGVHAIQMELAQSTYMHEAPPWTYSTAKAERLQRHLTDILETLATWRPA